VVRKRETKHLIYAIIFAATACVVVPLLVWYSPVKTCVRAKVTEGLSYELAHEACRSKNSN
jgi:hypothetical protein